MSNEFVKTIDVNTLHQLKEKNKTLCIIDVREQSEWDEMHIPGVTHCPKGQLCDVISHITHNKNQSIYLHCRGGTRSKDAALQLQKMGYTDVYSVDGGIMAWQALGFPTV